MPVSEFTREICRLICVERASQMEIDRLTRKEENMKRNGGSLTESQKAEDELWKAEVARLFDVAKL